jgi:molybdopterin molybdotransferase
MPCTVLLSWHIDGMLELEAAQQQILSLVHPLDQQSVELLSALGRTLAQPLRARHDLPLFDNSAMDGYAVRAEDVEGASLSKPALLRCIARIEAGHSPPVELRAGECVRLFTGSPLPVGSNAVIMQEDTRSDPERPDRVSIVDPVKPWENVRFRGEDVKQGATLLQEGTRLGAAQVAFAAACGYAEASVYRSPVVGLIATGSELCEPAQPLGPGQIYESNRTSLAALVRACGGEPLIYPLVRDDLDATRDALSKAFRQCDVVVTSGGVSVGEKDLVKAAFVELGGELNFWRVSIKPGKPFACGTWQGKVLFGLPGNPVSSFVTFLLLVRPALRKLQGSSETQLPARSGVLRQPLENRGGRRHFMRVHVDPAGGVRPAGAQASHLLYPLAHANGLVDVAPDTLLGPETLVSVLMWD